MAHDPQHKMVKMVNSKNRQYLHRIPGGELDECCICDQPTPFWMAVKDVPICTHCADTTSYRNIPSKREYLNKHGFNLPNCWAPHVYEL